MCFCLKLLVFYGNNAFVNFEININELNIQKCIYDLWIIIKNGKPYVIVCIIFLSILSAYCDIYVQFNIEAYIWFENKSWKILYTTTDGYAVCVFDNFIMMVKTDEIKTNYYCIATNGTYQFYKKSENKKLFHNFD